MKILKISNHPKLNLLYKTNMNIWQVFTKPSSFIKDVEQRRNAWILSVFTIILLIIFLSFMVYSFFNIKNYKAPLADLIGYLILIIIYLLSRSNFYRIGIVMAILLFPMNTFGNILQGTTNNPANTINFLVFSYVFVGIFFSITWTGIYSLIVVVAIWTLPTLAPETITDPTIIVQPITINALTALMVLVSKHHRNQVENERQDELKSTYDNTLAGWSKALEFRDKETKGHSQRVTLLAIQLAVENGITDDSALQNIRRGALLHDIGKMAISNNILLKIDPLTDEEWEQIYLHPFYAYQMLKDIPFLKPALDIPKFHHEKWDGTGYPEGLKGKEIPKAARIFSVIDVWDALRSDRPYRKAWSFEKTLNYMKDQRGYHFDPKVVDTFLIMIQNDAFIKF